jgi:hypothetical protein
MLIPFFAGLWRQVTISKWSAGNGNLYLSIEVTGLFERSRMQL